MAKCGLHERRSLRHSIMARCAKPDLERARLAQIVSRVGTLWHAATNLPTLGQ
jgi:hypothetical protein